ncbi:MAG: hypothetical protein ACTSPI_07055 [Candidatus Heimdallarchaeaceae archaeon]
MEENNHSGAFTDIEIRYTDRKIKLEGYLLIISAVILFVLSLTILPNMKGLMIFMSILTLLAGFYLVIISKKHITVSLEEKSLTIRYGEYLKKKPGKFIEEKYLYDYIESVSYSSEINFRSFYISITLLITSATFLIINFNLYIISICLLVFAIFFYINSLPKNNTISKEIYHTRVV